MTKTRVDLVLFARVIGGGINNPVARSSAQAQATTDCRVAGHSMESILNLPNVGRLPGRLIALGRNDEKTSYTTLRARLIQGRDARGLARRDGFLGDLQYVRA